MKGKTVQVEFLRFKATDNVELQGWYSEVSGETAVLHIHGKSGNGYENAFLDNLRQFYEKHGISFFSIDTRGRGVITSFKKGNETLLAGSCYEIFEECVFDIEGALEYLISRGKNKFILQGHSLGCAKVVYFITQKAKYYIEEIVLLAPTDMIGWASANDKSGLLMTKAKELAANGKGNELVAAKCWDDEEPLSAKTYISISEKGGNVDIYGTREKGSVLSRIGLPTLIVYGTNDVGITKVDGDVTNWIRRIDETNNSNIKVAIIDGANHGFRARENNVVKAIKEFLNNEKAD